MTGNRSRLGPCTFSGCTAPVVARDMCRTHYGRAWRGQALSATYKHTEPRNVCAAAGCLSAQTYKEFCAVHGRQWKNFGTTMPVGTVCETCGGSERMVVDHDHSCCPGKKTCGKCVRGFLCNRCNLALAYAQDDRLLLQRMSDYLARAEK